MSSPVLSTPGRSCWGAGLASSVAQPSRRHSTTTHPTRPTLCRHLQAFAFFLVHIRHVAQLLTSSAWPSSRQGGSNNLASLASAAGPTFSTSKAAVAFPATACQASGQLSCPE